MHFGIDFGGQLNGTTAVYLDLGSGLHCFQSVKGSSADHFLEQLMEVHSPASLYIDAPLSLPPALHSTDSDDFFYRQADKELKAMSPMFLGGLTARVMRLKRYCAERQVTCYETYPKAALLHHFTSLKHYKKHREHLAGWTDKLASALPMTIQDPPRNWHQLDALVCWWSGYRHRMGQHLEIGLPKEGIIIL